MRSPAAERILNAVSLVVVAGILGSLLAEYGFRLPPETLGRLHRLDFAILGLYFAEQFARLAFASDRRAHLAAHKVELALPGLFVALLFLSPHVTLPVGRGLPLQAAKATVAAVQVFLLVGLGMRLLRAHAALARLRLRPASMLVGSFLLVMLLGTLLLSLPAAVPEGRERLTSGEAAFTAVSATCVTGLTIIDIGTDLSRRGQWVLLGLIQVGGLGLMTCMAFFAVVVGQGMAMRERAVLGDLFENKQLGHLGRMLVRIVILTFTIEGIGAWLLHTVPWGDGNGDGVFHALFHAVSAFCNAGFALYPDSFIRFADSTRLVGTVSVLIVLGGLGFPVLINLLAFRWAGLAWLRRNKRFRKIFPMHGTARISLQSRLVLVTSAVLLLLGTIGFAFTEYNRIGWGDAVFQSVTCRTAGFNTIPTDELTDAGRFLTMMLMFVGASPGSTGGGLKTSTFALLLLSVFATIRGRPVELGGRSVPAEVLQRALIVLFGYLCLGAATHFTLCLTDPTIPFRDLQFETISACATVGLSTGITGDLSPAGRIVLMIAMFVGRVGPLTAVLAMSGPSTRSRYDYPSERVMVG